MCIEATPIEIAIELHAAGDLPIPAVNKLEQFVGGIPTVELHDDSPALRQ
jgi:hypothetical protein